MPPAKTGKSKRTAPGGTGTSTDTGAAPPPTPGWESKTVSGSQSADVNGLAPDTTYQVRVLSKSNSTNALGPKSATSTVSLPPP